MTRLNKDWKILFDNSLQRTERNNNIHNMVTVVGYTDGSPDSRPFDSSDVTRESNSLKGIG